MRTLFGYLAAIICIAVVVTVTVVTYYVPSALAWVAYHIKDSVQGPSYTPNATH